MTRDPRMTTGQPKQFDLPSSSLLYPRYSFDVATNIRKTFLKLLDKSFSKTHNFHEILSKLDIVACQTFPVLQRNLYKTNTLKADISIRRKKTTCADGFTLKLSQLNLYNANVCKADCYKTDSFLCSKRNFPTK